jgi:hypothetical protein
MDPDFRCEQPEQRDHLIGGSGELRPEIFALCGDAHRARVEVALTHHLASKGDERERPEAESFCTQQRRDHHVAPRPKPAIRLECDE